MLAQTAALLKETEREGGRGRETIGIAIDLADCVVGMSPARPRPPAAWLASIGALMVVDPSGSNHHLAGRVGREREREREREGGTEKGISSPLINHGRVSKQTEMS